MLKNRDYIFRSLQRNRVGNFEELLTIPGSIGRVAAAFPLARERLGRDVDCRLPGDYFASLKR